MLENLRHEGTGVEESCRAVDYYLEVVCIQTSVLACYQNIVAISDQILVRQQGQVKIQTWQLLPTFQKKMNLQNSFGFWN